MLAFSEPFFFIVELLPVNHNFSIIIRTCDISNAHNFGMYYQIGKGYRILNNLNVMSSFKHTKSMNLIITWINFFSEFNSSPKDCSFQ